MVRSHARADVFDLRPVLTIPFPGIVCRSGRNLSAEKDNAVRTRVIDHGGVKPSRRPDVLLLRPQQLSHFMPSRTARRRFFEFRVRSVDGCTGSA